MLGIAGTGCVLPVTTRWTIAVSALRIPGTIRPVAVEGRRSIVAARLVLIRTLVARSVRAIPVAGALVSHAAMEATFRPRLPFAEVPDVLAEAVTAILSRSRSSDTEADDQEKQNERKSGHKTSFRRLTVNPRFRIDPGKNDVKTSSIAHEKSRPEKKILEPALDLPQLVSSGDWAD